MGIAKNPRKRKVACKEGFKKEDGGENAFLLAGISVDKLLAANRHVHKSCPPPIKICAMCDSDVL